MNKIISLFLILIFPFISFAQINYSVKGKVLMTDGSLPTGNVIVLNPQDSTFIKGTSFFEKAFKIDDLNQTEILLKFTSLQFNNRFIRVVHNGESEIDLGDILVETLGIDLDEVVVKAKLPVFIQRPDGTVEVLIENTTLSASNSVNEILSKVPEVIVDGSGGISVLGKGSAIIYLNGKRITENQLALILPSNVKKIETIRNPSTKYDAEGGAVISITTIKAIEDGYKGSLKQNVSYAHFGGINSYFSLNVNFKKGRFSSNANYSNELGTEKEMLHTTRDRKPEDGFLTTDLTTNWNYLYDKFSHYGLGLQYNMDKKSYLSLEYSGFIEPLKGSIESNNKIVEDLGSNSFQSHVDVNEKDVNNSISLNYNKYLDTLGTSLFVGTEYARFEIGSNNFIIEENVIHDTSSLRQLENILDLNINIFSAQIDFVKKLKKKKSRKNKKENSLEVGLKYSNVKNDFNFDFLISPDGHNFELDDGRSNNFEYKENIRAAYFTFKGSTSKINYALGFRNEWTTYSLHLATDEKKAIPKDYHSFFPYFSVSRIFSDNYTLNLSYTSRINRVPYQMLNPILIYQDPYTSAQGNPDMKPQKRHAVEINTKLKKTSIRVGYNYIKDRFGQTALQGESFSSYILKRINYDESHMLYTSVSRTFGHKWWTSRNTISLRYESILDTQFEFQKLDSKPHLYFYTNNRFDITDSFKAEITFWYRGDNYDGLHLRKNMSNLSFTLEKSFLKKTLKCRLMANDVLFRFFASGNYNVGQTEVYYNRKWSTNYFRLSLVYDFGKLKKVNYKNKSTGTSENERVQ